MFSLFCRNSRTSISSCFHIEFVLSLKMQCVKIRRLFKKYGEVRHQIKHYLRLELLVAVSQLAQLAQLAVQLAALSWLESLHTQHNRAVLRQGTQRWGDSDCDRTIGKKAASRAMNSLFISTGPGLALLKQQKVNPRLLFLLFHFVSVGFSMRSVLRCVNETMELVLVLYEREKLEASSSEGEPLVETLCKNISSCVSLCNSPLCGGRGSCTIRGTNPHLTHCTFN